MMEFSIYVSLNKNVHKQRLKRSRNKKRRLTRSKAVAKIADRTASKHHSGSRDVIGHVTIFHSP